MPAAGDGEFVSGWGGRRQRDPGDGEFDALKPVGRRWDDAHVFGEMLQRQRSDGNRAAFGIDDSGAEKMDSLGDAFAMMMDRPMCEEGERTLAGVEPVMEGQVIGNRAAVCALRCQGMMVGVYCGVSVCMRPQATVRAAAAGRAWKLPGCGFGQRKRTVRRRPGEAVSAR